jgi:Tol biopolymer transport system component
LKDGDQVVTLQFLALQPQNLWGASPLYTTRKFAGNTYSSDLTLTPTNGILQVLKMEGGIILNSNDMEVYPNPYQDEVTITFKVEETTNATLSVYDLVGRKLVTILDTQIPDGEYNYTKNLGELKPGIYIVKLSVENGTPSFERIIKQ